MTTNEKYLYYLQDLSRLIKKYAREAKADSDARKNENNDFYQGLLAAYHRVITLMQQQAEGFDIDLSILGLEDIKPDIDLS